MSRELLIGTLIVTIVSLAPIVVFLQSRHDKRHIREYLLVNGASNIVVAWSGGVAYNIEYVDRKGERCYTSCVVKNSLFGGTALYWREPPVCE
ncbi:MAG: hypothetical protein U0559_18215 [Anaerolineae bacterium]